MVFYTLLPSPQVVTWVNVLKIGASQLLSLPVVWLATRSEALASGWGAKIEMYCGGERSASLIGSGLEPG